MRPVPRRRNRLVWSALVKRLALLAVTASIAAAGPASAQPPACATVSGFPPAATPVPQRAPRPPAGPQAVNSFVDSLTTTDAAFEVVMGQSRILTLKEDLAARGPGRPLIAVGDPSTIEVTPVSTRQLRVLGQRIGVTDLTIATADGRTYAFEVRVVADLDVLRAQLRCVFPDASLKLAQIRDHVVVEGEARDTAQVARILETIRAYLVSIQASQARRITGGQGPGGAPAAPGTVRPSPEREPLPPVPPVPVPGTAPPVALPPPGGVLPETNPPLQIQATIPAPDVINLIRVPGSQQVLLKVRVAELNRTALRQIGGDFLAVNPRTGAIVGTQIGGAGVSASALTTGIFRGGVPGLNGAAQTVTTANTTVFGIFQEGDFAVFLSALRRNNVLKLLAEPNLVTLNGHLASFLAGGEFPVPVTQTGTGGGAPAVTVQFREFGVRLGFVPFILDGDVIRLTVDPEVSTVDFALGTVLVPGGTPVPGLNTRKAHTVVELRQGQTLAIAGLMQLILDGTTSRIPIMGDLPIIGPFFSNTTSTRTEKELLVLVTPYLVEPMNPGQVPPSPGDEVNAPNDLEFYLLNRIEGRTGRDARATTNYDDPFYIVRCLLKLEQEHVRGPHGFCE